MLGMIHRSSQAHGRALLLQKKILTATMLLLLQDNGPIDMMLSLLGIHSTYIGNTGARYTSPIT